MAQERAQSLLIPQPGYLLAQPGFTPIPPIAPTFATLAHNPPFMRQQLPVSPPTFSEPITQSTSQRANHFPTSDTDSQDRDYRIISYDELEQLLPDPKPTVKMELGVLPNGCAYAPKSASRDQYLLFPSKSSYVRYFTHHYFSRENLSRDMTFLNMLINRLVLPVELLVQAPRLAAVNTTFDDVAKALMTSSIVCFEDIGAGLRGVRRIDGYPVSVLKPEESTTTSQYDAAGDSYPSPTGSFPITASVGTQDPRQNFHPSVTSTYPVDGITEHAEVQGPPKCFPSVGPSVAEQGAFSTPTSDPISFLCNIPPNYAPTPSSHISLPSSYPSSTMNCLVDQPLVSSDALLVSTQACTQATPSLTARSTFWPPHQTHFLSGYQRHSLPSGSSHAVGDSNPLTCNPQTPNLLGFSTRLPYQVTVHPTNAPTEIQPMFMPSVRQPPLLPHYLLGNSGHCPTAYHSTLSFGSGGTNTNTMNLAAPSAAAHQTQVHLNPTVYPTFPGHMLPTVSNHIAAATHHQAAAALAAAAAQQQQQVYFGTSLHQGYSSNTHHPALNRAAPSPLSLYYTPNPIALPQLPRTHPVHRLQPGPVYAIYQPSQQSSLLQNPLQVNSELVKGDTASVYNPSTATAQTPILWPPHFTLLQQFNNAHSHNLVMSELASAASGLCIQNPPKPRPLSNVLSNNSPCTVSEIPVPVSTESGTLALRSISPSSADGCREALEDSGRTSLPCSTTQTLCRSPSGTPVSSALTSDFSTGDYTDNSLTANSLTDANRSCSGIVSGFIKRSESENSSHGSVSSGIDDTGSPCSTNARAGNGRSSTQRVSCVLPSVPLSEARNRHKL